MFLVGKNKLKITIEEDECEDVAKTFIEYYKIKQKDVFKVNVLMELIEDNLCLGVIDSKLLYSGSKEKSKIIFKEIIDHLDFTKIAYKKIEINKIPQSSIFGITVKQGSKKIHKDYIIGFVVNKDTFKMIEAYVNKLNMYYFIDKTGIGEEALLQKLSENYDHVDGIIKDFHCQIFNNNFINKLAILSKIKSVTEIKEIVNKCYSELQ